MQLLGVIVEERGSLYIVTEYMAKVSIWSLTTRHPPEWNIVRGKPFARVALRTSCSHVVFYAVEAFLQNVFFLHVNVINSKNKPNKKNCSLHSIL